MNQKTGIFVSGTDTAVGKTLISSLLVSGLKAHGKTAGYYKPVQTGSDLDTETVSQFCYLEPTEISAPTYQFALPAAPSRAAHAEGVQIELEQILTHWQGMDPRSWVIEGAGGLLVPLNTKQTIRELICLLKLKLLLVASTRLGTINHTLLSLAAAKSAQIDVAGIVLVGDDDPGLESVFAELTDVPVLSRVPHLPLLSPQVVQGMGPRYFTPDVIARLYG